MTDQQWPPPSYYTSFNPSKDRKEREARLHSIDAAILTDDAGKRTMRFQTPTTPVMPGTLRLDGVLEDRSDGLLYTFPPNPKVAGTVDYATGLIVIDLDVSPGTCSRYAEYQVGLPPTGAC